MEYVVCFPERLKTGQPDNGRMVLFRFEPQFLVEPLITVVLSRTADKRIVYEYAIANAASAKRSVAWFSLVAEHDDSSLTTEHPAWVTYGVGTPGPAHPVAPQAALFEGPELRSPANMGKYVSWSASDRAPRIQPGASVGGFRLQSEWLPGLTTAYTHTNQVLRIPFELPPEVHDQIVPLLAPEHNYRATATIGPRFRPVNGAPRDTERIAADYERGITRLVRDRRLSGDSPFVVELRSVLAAAGKPGGRDRIHFRSTPRTTLEREIAAAVAMALDLAPR